MTRTRAKPVVKNECALCDGADRGCPTHYEFVPINRPTRTSEGECDMIDVTCRPLPAPP